MDSTLGTFSPARARCALVLALAIGVAAGSQVARALAAPGEPARDVGALLHVAALATLSACALWAAAILVALIRENRRGTQPPGWLCPPACRHALLAVCSIGAVVGVAAPGSASPADIGGAPAAALPSLDRPASAAGRLGGPQRIVVAPGDSLWSLVRTRHPGADTAATARRVRELYRTNIEVIGADPDRIRPGQVLRVPARDGSRP